MSTTQTILLLLLIFSTRKAASNEDLLDQYVRHVDTVNRIENVDNRNLVISHENQRHRRATVVDSDYSTKITLKSNQSLNAAKPSKRSHLSKKFLRPVNVRKTKLEHFWTEDHDHLMRFRSKRSVDFPMRPISTNNVGEGFMNRRKKIVQRKPIVSNFTPDLNPYLQNMHKEINGNDLNENEEVFRRRKRSLKNLRKKRDFSDMNQWTHAATLDPNGRVLLRWQPRHQEILFRVEARTLGYVGIGFSPNGRMEGADIVVGWVDDKSLKPYLNDYHGAKDQGSEPVKDEFNNYTLMKGGQNDTHTFIEFRRALDTCDPDDYILSADTVRVIWALHDSDPQKNGANGLLYHEENRGSQSLHLLGPRPTQRKEKFQTWDVTLKNFEVENNMDTIYWCKIIKAPMLRNKHHIIGFEPIIGKNHTNLVHHMLLHECPLTVNDNLQKWDEYAQEQGRPCYEDEGLEWEKCLSPVVAWAIGSKGEDFPHHFGIPLAEKPRTYYRLEVHFDNPKMKKAVDTSGLRLHYTSNLRPNEGGILVTGISLSPLHVIPPMQLEYKSSGYCDTGCTEKMFPKDGINVISVLLHSHLAGRRLKLRHIRGDQELPPVAEDNHYDFNYQQSRVLPQEIKILPGDGLVTECAYNTRNRTKITFGGYSTQQEMCLAFVLHYPRTELAGCYSMPPVTSFFNRFGVEQFYHRSMSELEKQILQGSFEPVTTPPPQKPRLFTYNPGEENLQEADKKAIIALQNAKPYTIEQNAASNNILEELVIEKPAEFESKTFMSHLEALPYNDAAFTQKIEEAFYSGLHLAFCRKRDDKLAMKESPVGFPNFKPYSPNESKFLCSYRTRSVVEAQRESHAVNLKAIPVIILLAYTLILNYMF